MEISIPGRKSLEIENIVFDFNGTIAIDGTLIDTVYESINELSGDLNFHVITADTYGNVTEQLKGCQCEVVVIGKENQDVQKCSYVKKLGSEKTIAVGNGRNDLLMLKEAEIGIALIQDEGLYCGTLLNADILMKSINDVFKSLKNPKRLIAGLRN